MPPSCFALADLSPFQHGYGSLQIFSVHQKVPSCLADDFLLTGLRRDTVTASAPGVFVETPVKGGEQEKRVDDPEHPISGVRHPSKLRNVPVTPCLKHHLQYSFLHWHHSHDAAAGL